MKTIIALIFAALTAAPALAQHIHAGAPVPMHRAAVGVYTSHDAYYPRVSVGFGAWAGYPYPYYGYPYYAYPYYQRYYAYGGYPYFGFRYGYGYGYGRGYGYGYGHWRRWR